MASLNEELEAGSGGGGSDPGTLDQGDTFNDLENAMLQQFDDREGGGAVDEAAAVVDPTQAASASTEQTLRDDGVQETATWVPFVGPIARFALETNTAISDEIDERAGRETPDERAPTPGTTPTSDDEEVLSDISPTELALDVGQDARDAANDAANDALGINADMIVAGVVLLVVLYLVRPLLSIFAGVTN